MFTFDFVYDIFLFTFKYFLPIFDLRCESLINLTALMNKLEFVLKIYRQIIPEVILAKGIIKPLLLYLLLAKTRLFYITVVLALASCEDGFLT